MSNDPEFDRKLSKALAILDKTGMSASSYKPLAYRGLWRLGVKIRPAPFNPVWSSIIWVIFTYSVMIAFITAGQWLDHMPIFYPAQITGACVMLGAGALIGMWREYQRRKYRLPKWEDL